MIINCYLWLLEALPPTPTGALPMDPAGDPLGPLFYFPLTKSWLRPPCLQCSRKRVQQLKKNVKSHVFLDFEKNVKKRKYSYRGHLITPVFHIQLPNVSNGKSPTSNMLLCNNVGVRTYKRGTVNRGTVKRGQLIAGQLIACHLIADI